MHTTFFTVMIVYLIGCLLSTMLCHPIYDRVCRLNEDDAEFDATDVKFHNIFAAVTLVVVALSSWLGAAIIVGIIIYFITR